MSGDMSDDDQVTSGVLRRKREAASGRGQPQVSRPIDLHYGVLTWTKFLNGAVLVLTLWVGSFNFFFVLGTDVFVPFLAWMMFLMFAVVTTKVSIDPFILPVLVSGSVAPLSLPLNLGLTLSNLGLMGTAEGIIVAMLSPSADIYTWVAPAVNVGVKRILASVTEESLTDTERSLLSAAILNLCRNGGQLYQGILFCGVLGFVPCSWLVRDLRRLAQDRRYFDLTQQRMGRVTWMIYAMYFVTASSSFWGYCYITNVGIAELVGLITNSSKTIVYWIVCLATAFFTASTACKDATLDTRRKLWHICAAVMFLPTSYEPITKIALAVAIALFLFLEMVRSSGLPGAGPLLHKYLGQFTDTRDTKGPFIVSHIFLLLGIAAPVFAGGGSPAGAISLGLGDAFASGVGHRFGKHKSFGAKSLEGTLAFFLASLVGTMVFLKDVTVLPAVISCFLTALLEAVTPLNDNLVLPLYMLAVYDVSCRMFSK